MYLPVQALLLLAPLVFLLALQQHLPRPAHLAYLLSMNFVGIITNSMPEGMTVQGFLKSVPHPKDKSKEFIQILLKIAKSEDRGGGRKVVLKENRTN